jgi:hypothetical protein
VGKGSPFRTSWLRQKLKTKPNRGPPPTPTGLRPQHPRRRRMIVTSRRMIGMRRAPCSHAHFFHPTIVTHKLGQFLTSLMIFATAEAKAASNKNVLAAFRDGGHAPITDSASRVLKTRQRRKRDIKELCKLHSNSFCWSAVTTCACMPRERALASLH